MRKSTGISLSTANDIMLSTLLLTDLTFQHTGVRSESSGAEEAWLSLTSFFGKSLSCPVVFLALLCMMYT